MIDKLFSDTLWIYTGIAKCEIFKGAFDSQMDSYYGMWIERCEYMKTQTLPSDWKGVFIAST